MRKNYFLSLLLLMIAFWKVEAKEREISKETASTSTTMAPTLPAPTEFNFSPVGGTGNRLNLYWRDNAVGETSFQIAISVDGVNFSSDNASQVLGNFGSKQLTGLTAGKKYWFAVRAVKDNAGPTVFSGCTTTVALPDDNTKQYSCWSNIITATTNPNIPNPPSDARIPDGWTQTTATLIFNDNSTDEQGFLIQRSVNGGAYQDLATISSFPSTGERNYIDRSLAAATLYRYRVFSFNSSGYSTLGAESPAFVTKPNPPETPSDLQSDWQTLNQIHLLWWDRSDNEDAFVIERSNDGGSWYVITDTWFPNAGYFTDENVLEGHNYWYRIRAVNTGGYSGYSNVINVSTKKRVPPPPPYDLQAKTVSTKRIDLNWSNHIYGEYDIPLSTELYRSSVGENDGFVQIAILAPEQYTYSDTTGKPKTKYWYKLLAANTFGQSPYSNVASATTLGPPSKPTNLQVIATKDSLGNDILVARWTDTSDDEDYFVLDRATDVNFSTNVLNTSLVKNYTSATSIPIEEGVTYFFRIRAVNEHGSSDYTDFTSITSFYTAVPNAPYALKATATVSTVTLKWGDDSNKEEGFEIERSTDGTNFGKVTTTNRSVTTYVDNTVAANTKYWYRVRAINPKGVSAYTDVVVITTPAATSGFVANADLITSEAWQVYPNPTTDAVKVTLPESMQNQVGVVTVIDRMNREVFKTKLNSNQTEYRLDFSNYSEGTYTISIRTNTQQISKRVYKY